MKVLSIIEPFATLIKDNKKGIETRSWKTNYRGELYIHASASKEFRDWKDDKNIISDIKLNYGYIICKCKLVDCIYMDEEYVRNMKANNPTEYSYGIYEVGRYAWVLDNVEVLDVPIEAKGKLGIWNFDE